MIKGSEEDWRHQIDMLADWHNHDDDRVGDWKRYGFKMEKDPRFYFEIYMHFEELEKYKNQKTDFRFLFYYDGTNLKWYMCMPMDEGRKQAMKDHAKSVFSLMPWERYPVEYA